MYKFECSVKVRYSEVDSTGFVHHANYFNWFDIAQEEMIASLGFQMSQMEERGFRFLPLSNSCNYKTPACYGDTVRIRLKIVDVKSIRVVFEYDILRERDGKLLATGKSEHIIVDNNMRVTSIERAFPGLFDSIMDK